MARSLLCTSNCSVCVCQQTSTKNRLLEAWRLCLAAASQTGLKHTNAGNVHNCNAGDLGAAYQQLIMQHQARH
jgi:hypothetical protein